MRTPSIRAATPSDVGRLLALETDTFVSDRLSLRSFRHFVRSPTAALRVVVDTVGIAGYSLLVFRAGSRVARLYSIAIDGRTRGRGLGAMLLADAERTAAGRGLDRLGLEVREDNGPAIQLYERLGYRLTGRIADYYEDGAGARRYEKRLEPPKPQSREADG
jgi:ribosomal protein S18 acetylase RimI-like enzyme